VNGFYEVQFLNQIGLLQKLIVENLESLGLPEFGKAANADLVVIKGDPSKQISEVENVEIVFKDGVGYDSQKLLDSVKGRYGEY
jgi:imidazolonepropionase-like amidohydrolase